VLANRLLFYSAFNAAGAAALNNNQWKQSNTTLTVTLNGGFARLNSAAVTTTNTGIALTSAPTFSLEGGTALSIKSYIRHFGGTLANKQFDFGYGMYAVGTANQVGATTEFVGFRWTVNGDLIGVLEYTNGSNTTKQVIEINSGNPYSDGAVHEYEVVITLKTVEFWIDRVYVGYIKLDKNVSASIHAAAWPVIYRLYIVHATVLAPMFEIGSTTVVRRGTSSYVCPPALRQSLMGRTALQTQSGINATSGTTGTNNTSATTPTATTANTTTTALSGLGGNFALNGASFNITANTHAILNSFQNNAIPIALGAVSDSRVLVITGVQLSQLVVTTVLAGGPAVWTYQVMFGNTALSLATTDAAGTTAIGSRAPRYLPLSIVDNVAATAAAGTLVTRNGDSTILFNTPIPVMPGEFIGLVARPLSLTAVTSGVFSGAVGWLGYWE
jgi:hypothetical protein